MGVEGENRGYGVKKLDEPFFFGNFATHDVKLYCKFKKKNCLCQQKML